MPTEEEIKRAVYSSVIVRTPKGPLSPKGRMPFEPDELQENILFSKAKRVVACLGRRRCKSLTAAMKHIGNLSVPGHRSWVVAPTYDSTGKVFSRIWDAIVVQKVYGENSVKRCNFTQNERYIEMAWKEPSFVRGKSTDAIRSIKGEDLHDLTYDECAGEPEQIWTEYLEPCLVDHDGSALFISTPKGMNWFEQYYQRGLNSDLEEWESYHSPTWENPFLSEEVLRNIRATTPDDVWRQEYGAEFVSFSGLIYKDFVPRIYPDGHLYDPTQFQPEGRCCVIRAIDVGWKHPTVCLWAMIEEHTNNVYIFQEYKEKEAAHEYHAQNISALSLEPVVATYISPDAARTHPIKIADDVSLSADTVYREAGIYTTRASDRLLPGISIVTRYLRSTLNKNSSEPNVLISTACKNLIAALGRYSWKESRSLKTPTVQQVPSKVNDDEADTFRYLLASGGGPVFRESDLEFSELSQIALEKTSSASQVLTGIQNRNLLVREHRQLRRGSPMGRVRKGMPYILGY